MSKLGTESKVRVKQFTGNKKKKRKGPNWFSPPKSILKRISPPVLDLLHLQLHCCSISLSINQSLVRIETHKSCELIPNFTQVTNILKLRGYTNIDVIFKVTLSLGPGLTLQSLFSSPIWVQSIVGVSESGHHHQIKLDIHQVTRLAWFVSDKAFKFKGHYEPAMKMQVKAKPRPRASPPHTGKRPFSLNLAAGWGQILMLSVVEGPSILQWSF